MDKKLIAFLATIISAATLTVWATSLLAASQNIPNTGSLETIGVNAYWESSCINNVTYINWTQINQGYLEPGTTIDVTIYIKNNGNIPLVLNMTTDNWSPPGACNDIALSWNCEGHVLNTTSPVVQTVLTLSVSPNCEVTKFYFDIIIIGREYTPT
jgi:hypothetical protein